jgi:hypothetical protein
MPPLFKDQTIQPSRLTSTSTSARSFRSFPFTRLPRAALISSDSGPQAAGSYAWAFSRSEAWFLIVRMMSGCCLTGTDSGRAACRHPCALQSRLRPLRHCFSFHEPRRCGAGHGVWGSSTVRCTAAPDSVPTTRAPIQISTGPIAECALRVVVHDALAVRVQEERLSKAFTKRAYRDGCWTVNVILLPHVKESRTERVRTQVPAPE